MKERGDPDSTAAVRVLVRVRPFSTKEAKEHGHDHHARNPIVHMTEGTTTIGGEGGSRTSTSFSFDKCFWSLANTQSTALPHADQEYVYEYIGPMMVRSIWSGYNTCLFAYGQTGSGKTYTMMGEINCPQSRGIIPRLCLELFEKIQSEKSEQSNLSFRVDASYHEIYNEKVKDLLSGGGKTKDKEKDLSGLRVRQHPVSGPFVEGLSSHEVNDARGIHNLLRRGDAERSTASTQMNDRSSRSHAIFTLTITRLEVTATDGTLQTKSRSNKVNLVDLAGSERVAASGAQGERFEEARNINLSLATLGRVIDCLVERGGSRAILPPYRESILTWLLLDSLGGNSQTFMVATVSPSGQSYNETLSTLRYSAKARSIINTATVNKEEESGKQTAELKAKLHTLQGRLRHVEQRESRQVEALEERCALAEAEVESQRDAVAAMEVKLGNKSRQKDDDDRSARLLKEERSKSRRLEKQVKRLEQQLEVEQFNFEQETRELSQQIIDEQLRHRTLQADLDAKEDEVRRLFEEQDKAAAERDTTFAQLQRLRAAQATEAETNKTDEAKSHRINVLRKIARDQEIERERAEEEARTFATENRSLLAQLRDEQTRANEALKRAKKENSKTVDALKVQLQQLCAEKEADTLSHNAAHAEAQKTATALEAQVAQLMVELAASVAEAAKQAPPPTPPTELSSTTFVAELMQREAEADALRAQLSDAERRTKEVSATLKEKVELHHAAAVERETEASALRKQLGATQAERDALAQHVHDASIEAAAAAQLHETAAAEALLAQQHLRTELANATTTSTTEAEKLHSEIRVSTQALSVLQADVLLHEAAASNAAAELEEAKAESAALREAQSALEGRVREVEKAAATQGSAERRAKSILQSAVKELQEKLSSAEAARDAEVKKRGQRGTVEEDLVRLNRQLREKVQAQAAAIATMEAEARAREGLDKVSRLFDEQETDMRSLAKAQVNAEMKATRLRSSLGEAVDQFAELTIFKQQMACDVQHCEADLNVV